MRFREISALTAAAACLAACAHADAGAPISTPAFSETDLVLTTATGRDVPVRAFLPAEDCSPCTLIIFSHGAYATYDRYDVLLTDWASRGYVVVAPQHVDSEEHPDREAYTMASSRPARLEDYALVSATFAASEYALEGRSFSGRQIAAGHSYGALIAQVAGGARLLDPDLTLSEAAQTPEAVIALSPPSELDGLVNEEGFAHIGVPMLLVTGTTDTLPGFIDDWQGHLDGYDASAPEFAYALVYEGMNHYFNGAYGRETPGGMADLTAVRDLNARIDAFIEDALDHTLPTGPAWRAQSNALVTARTKQGDFR